LLRLRHHRSSILHHRLKAFHLKTSAYSIARYYPFGLLYYKQTAAHKKKRQKEVFYFLRFSHFSSIFVRISYCNPFFWTPPTHTHTHSEPFLKNIFLYFILLFFLLFVLQNFF
jgi:hypothetical protein